MCSDQDGLDLTRQKFAFVRRRVSKEPDVQRLTFNRFSQKLISGGHDYSPPAASESPLGTSSDQVVPAPSAVGHVGGMRAPAIISKVGRFN